MSSDLSSPPTTYEFDVEGESFRKAISLSPTMRDKLNLALTHAKTETHEHHTVRYVMILLHIIFFDEKFNILPQFYTWSGCYPDIALEVYYTRPGSWRNCGFVCTDFFEAKPAASGDDPFVQLRRAVSEEFRVFRYSKGVVDRDSGFKMEIYGVPLRLST